jgi:hypothetical protein
MTERAQTTLPATAVALVILTTVTGIGIAMADSAITSAERTPSERHIATATATQLVSPDGPLAVRPNVVNHSNIEQFDGEALRAISPAVAEHDVRVTLDGEEIAVDGDPNGGTTIYRLVRVQQRETRTIEPDETSVTLPRRATGATLTITGGTTVWTVRANERVVLHNSSGLRGTFEIDIPEYTTTELRLQTAGSVNNGSVSIDYDTAQTTKGRLAVIVDV